MTPISHRVVFPDKMTRVEEIRRYTLNNFIGDVGGVFGLFLGFSTFTFLEYIYFSVFYIVKKLLGRVEGEWLKSVEFEDERDVEMVGECNTKSVDCSNVTKF